MRVQAPAVIGRRPIKAKRGENLKSKKESKLQSPVDAKEHEAAVIAKAKAHCLNVKMAGSVPSLASRLQTYQTGYLGEWFCKEEKDLDEYRFEFHAMSFFHAFYQVWNLS